MLARTRLLPRPVVVGNGGNGCYNGNLCVTAMTCWVQLLLERASLLEMMAMQEPLTSHQFTRYPYLNLLKVVMLPKQCNEDACHSIKTR